MGDSSYGCPQPGRAYLTVISPGHKITLRANGQIYVVHEAKQSAFVCHKTEAYAGVTPQRELVFGQQMLEAQQDLVNRLGVLKSEIKPVSGVQETWDDASLGCPQAGRNLPLGQGHRMGAHLEAWDTRLHVPHRHVANDSVPCHLDRVTRPE